MSYESSRDIIEVYLRNELRVVNKSLPVRRKTLSELINEKYPYVVTRDGGIHMFRRSELALAYKVLGDELSKKLLLPIILEVRTEFKETVMVVNDEVAVILISRLLGLRDASPPLYIYPPQLALIRNKIGSLIQYAFIVT